MEDAADEAHDRGPVAASAREAAGAFPAIDRAEDRRRAGDEEARPDEGADEQWEKAGEQRGVRPQKAAGDELGEFFAAEPAAQVRSAADC